ncbi:MAG: hypothetical protein ACOCUP_03350 [bacterium]
MFKKKKWKTCVYQNNARPLPSAKAIVECGTGSKLSAQGAALSHQPDVNPGEGVTLS